MNKLFLLSILTLSLGACMQERMASTPPGEYKKTSVSTDSRGTTTVKESSTKVEVDQYGNKTAVVKSKTTKDPEGLFNKTTTNQSEHGYYGN